MRVKLIFIVSILVLLILIINIVSNKNGISEFKPIELEIGDEFLDIKYDNTMYVLNYKIEDINNDEKNDMIIVVGERNGDETNLMANNIDIVIYDTASQTFTKGNVKKCDGLMPRIDIYNMTGSNNNDILLTIENENKIKSIRVIAYDQGEVKEVFKLKDNKGIIFAGKFNNDFKLNLLSTRLKLNKNIDLNDKKENYIASGFYDDAGRLLKENARIYTTGFTDIEIVEMNGQKAIQTTQRICGFDDMDIIDQITAIWKYENGRWSLKEAFGEKLGNLLY